jgi:hypothetical protein
MANDVRLPDIVVGNPFAVDGRRWMKGKSMNRCWYQMMLLGAVVFLTAPASSADPILFENPPDLHGEGNNHFTSPRTIGAEDFALSTAATVTSVAFMAHHDPITPQPSSISWFLYDDAGDPGRTVASGTNLYTTTVVGAVRNYLLTYYTIHIPAIALHAGTYWVGFHLNDSEGDPHWSFAASGNVRSAISSDNGSTWLQPYPGSTMTFRVEGQPAASAPVPEPATLILLGSAVAGGCIRKLRRRGPSARDTRC